MPACPARPLSLDEIPLLHAANPRPRTRALIWLGLCAGLRIGEIIRLNVGHVVDPHGAIRDELRLDSDVILKHGKARSIPVNPLLRLALNAHCLTLPNLNPHAPLFPSNRVNRQRISRRQAMREIVAAFDRAGLHGALSSHALRKTFATAVHKACGNDLHKTQLALAHASPASTVAYLETCDPQVRESIRTLYLAQLSPELPFR